MASAFASVSALAAASAAATSSAFTRVFFELISSRPSSKSTPSLCINLSSSSSTSRTFGFGARSDKLTAGTKLPPSSPSRSSSNSSSVKGSSSVTVIVGRVAVSLLSGNALITVTLKDSPIASSIAAPNKMCAFSGTCLVNPCMRCSTSWRVIPAPPLT